MQLRQSKAILLTSQREKKKNKGTEPGMPWGAEGLDLPDNSSLPLEAWSG